MARGSFSRIAFRTWPNGERLIEIDHPEESAARYRLDAILAVGERCLQRIEVDHLGKRQSHHGEIDALAADGEAAEDETEQRRRRRAEEDREFRRQAPDLGAVRGEVAGGAEERSVAEGEQPDIANQEVEGAGEEREAQRLHQEDGVEHE